MTTLVDPDALQHLEGNDLDDPAGDGAADAIVEALNMMITIGFGPEAGFVLIIASEPPEESPHGTRIRCASTMSRSDAARAMTQIVEDWRERYGVEPCDEPGQASPQ